jgi:type IV fimbrial biogenesis protein FimT
MRYYLQKNVQGLTLLELLVTMAMIALFAVIGVPSFITFMANERLAVATNELYNAYRFARNEALKTSSPMTLAAVDSTNWAKEGWQVTNSDGELLFKSKVPHSSITVSASAITILGRGSVAASVNYSVSGDNDANCIRIVESGQSQLQSGTCL